MATLQTTTHGSAILAKARLSQVVQEGTDTTRREGIARPSDLKYRTADSDDETLLARKVSARLVHANYDALSEAEQTEVLLTAAFGYPEWRLVSVHKQPERNVRIAWLVHICDTEEPTELIRQGRAMRIMIDAVGEMRISQPPRALQPAPVSPVVKRSWWQRFASRFVRSRN